MSPVQILAFLFDLFIYVVLLRFLLQLTRADFYNPLSQFVIRLTQPILKPLRRVIPGLGGIDLASVLLALALVVFKIAVIYRLALGAWPGPLLLVKGGVFGLTMLLLQLLFWLVLVRALLSWVDPYGSNPTARVLGQLTEPMLRPIRRIIPPIGGLDLSLLFLSLLLLFLQWALGQIPGAVF